MARLFRDLSPKTQKKWHEMTRLTMDECLREESAKSHGRIWRVPEIARRSNIVNEREEIFFSYDNGKRVLRVMEPIRSFMKKLLDASMTNGGNAVWDLDYTSPKFGECGYVIRINERVPYGLIKHLNVVPAGCAKRSFELIFNLGDKLESVDVAAEELSRIPSIDPYLTILLAMYYLKRGDHSFERDIVVSMLETLRLLEKDIAQHREGDSYYEMLTGLLLLPPPAK